MFSTAIKDTFNFFKTHWLMLALISVPLVLLSEAIKYSVGPVGASGASLGDLWFYFGEIVFVFSLLQVSVILYIHAAVNGPSLGVMQSWRLGFSWLLPYLGLSLLTLLPVALGLLLFIIPGIIVMVRLMLAPYIFLLENLGAKASLMASWERTKGHFGDLVMGGIVIMLPITIISRLVASSQEMMTSSIKVAAVASIETFFGLILSVYLYRIYSLIKAKQ
ncbi:MAG: YciC family protein [Gammaproteobacteria bacterium]|nr:YciC family protein [Gammaproteobacteria bacterium]